MLNEERVKLMVKLASYEEKEGKEDFRVGSYYKKDYVSFNRWMTVIWVTIGYFVAVGIWGFSYMDRILDQLTFMKAVGICAGILGIYVVLLVGYWLLAGKIYKKKHEKARNRTKRYGHNLLVLNKLYEKENV